jgi:hypothetical protein
MSKLLTNIGRSIIIAQQIEVTLGMMLMMERKERFSTINAFMDGMAKTRLQVLESLKNELLQQGVTYVDYAKLGQIIEQRNWVAHRLIFDKRFVMIGANLSDDDFIDVVCEFYQFQKELLSAFITRASELGLKVAADGEPDLTTLITAFTLHEKTEELRAAKTKTKSSH